MAVSRTEILALAGRFASEATELRRRIHRHPELAGQEHQTAALVREVLARTAADVLPPLIGTDVVALIHGRGPGRNVTLRADMDALPLQEQTGASYQSLRPGLMHACGHDGHTAMLLAVALALDELRDRFDGSVRLVFQPGEEIAALGRDLVEAGALDLPAPDAVYALHGAAGYPVGTIFSRPGPMMAAAGFFTITVIGKGGHGSRPEVTIDPIVIGARIVEALQSIVSRRVDPQAAAVISVCRFESGKNANVIPERAELEGTVRFLDAGLGERLREMIETTVKGICLAAEADYRFEYRLPYRPTVNHPACVYRAKEVTAELFGPEHWQDMTRASMGGEDFCYYLERYPGALCDLGIGLDRPDLHHPCFDFNDDAIAAGVAFFLGVALRTLQN